MNTTPVLIANNTDEHMRILEVKLKQAREDLKAHPSYANSRLLQHLKREYDATATERRAKLKIAHNFENALMDNITRFNASAIIELAL